MLQSIKAVRIFQRDIAPRFFDREIAAQQIPALSGGLDEQKRGLAFRVMGCREKNVGVEKKLIHRTSAALG